jgi:ADP-heptose:LPS heptosyltransferase/tetratricopeptide (TPR) repeat protein
MNAKDESSGLGRTGLAARLLGRAPGGASTGADMIPRWRRERNVHARADQARDRGDWAAAAELYAKAVAQDPGRDDLRIQLGNCLKEAGRFEAAFNAYRAVTSPAERDEANLQLGHLLKVSANYAAAREAYLRAASGSAPGPAAAASSELRGIFNLRLSAARLSEPRSAALEDALRFRRAILESAFCEIIPSSVPRILVAGHACLDAGFTHEARCWFELAYVLDAAAPDENRSIADLAAETGLWRDDPIEFALLDERSDATPEDARVRALNAILVNQFAVSSEVLDIHQADLSLSRALERTLLSGKRAFAPEGGDWIRVYAGSGREDLTLPASGACRTLLGALSLPRDQSPDHVRAALATIAGMVGESPVLASFVGDMNAADTRRSVQRAYANVCAAAFDRLARLPELIDLCRPVQLAPHVTAMTDASSVEIGGAASDRAPLSRLVIRALPASVSVELADAAVAGLFDLTSLDEPRALFTSMANAGLTRIGGLSIVCRVQELEGALHSLVVLEKLVTGLREIGAWNSAVRVGEYLCFVRPESVNYRLDLALMNKTLGRFDRARDGLLSVLRVAPERPETAQELAWVAPETLSPEELQSLALQFPAVEIALHGRSLSYLLDEPFAAAPDTGSMFSFLFRKSQRSVRPDPLAANDRIDIIQTGWRTRMIDGVTLPLLSGVSFVRARVVASGDVMVVRIRADGRTIYQSEGPAAFVSPNGRRVYYINAWFDARSLRPGRRRIQIYAQLRSSAYMASDVDVIVDHASPDFADDSDAAIPTPPSADTDVEAYVHSLPSVMRPSQRTAFGAVERVLLQRLDQLGDTAASIPAMKRLKEAFAGASLSVLVTPANREFMEASGLFDRVYTAPFAYNHATRRRSMSRAEEARLRDELGLGRFDVAIDLSPGADSRPILLLSKARRLVGFNPHDFPYLDFGIDFISRDSINRKHNVSHTTMISALAEAIATAAAPAPAREPRRSPGDDALLAAQGLTAKTYITLHSGARLAIKRWPMAHYIELANLVTRELDIPVAFFADDPLTAEQKAQFTRYEKVVLFEGRVTFETLDAVLAHSRAVVGNDTGPKHLASLRGAKVVSVHMGQVNWNEWGQDGDGLIVSRRTPCCGCGIEDPSECGKDLACLTFIRPTEILSALRTAIGE